ncbi:hypothetical protein LTR49_006540 [Elasticomyces elasticus]|nr:hypothetical protein LTR49_006540 [Elasticomyces elasticus]
MGNTDSRPLMCGRIEARQQDGRVYYFHTDTRATSFEKPKQEDCRDEVSRTAFAIAVKCQQGLDEKQSQISQLQAQIKASQSLVTQAEARATKFEQANGSNLKRANQLLAEQSALQHSVSRVPELREVALSILFTAVFLLFVYGTAFIKRHLSERRILSEGRRLQQTVALSKGAADLFRTSKYSNLTVMCGGLQWNVHKSIICTQSDFFAKACDGSFREAKEARIDLSDDDHRAVAALLYFFYHGEYCAADAQSKDLPPMLLYVKLYVLADKYFSERLRQVSLSKLVSDMSMGYKTHAFADTVVEIYATTSSDNQLRALAVKVTKEHASSLFGARKYNARFKQVAWSTPEFAADVARALATS